MRVKRWTIAAPNPAAPELAANLKTSPILAQVLLNRGLSLAADCQAFLRPSLNLLSDPALLPNIKTAAARIAQAIAAKQRIVIYGDYDVDGITATTILFHAITILGGQVDFYIPHRIEEGYGLNSEAIAEICDSGAGLIVSVDCGVTAIEPALLAKQRGVDLIITDHHEFHADRLPDCYAIVHPRLAGGAGESAPYPNPHLCGAGVAFKLAWEIGRAVSGQSRVSDEFREFLLEATALAALGTIADVVPLIGENRVIATFGLGGLKKSHLRGLQSLIASAGLTGQSIDSYDVGFKLAPRLNACGRMGHARLAVELLTRADQKRADEIATYLEQQNRQRQTIERQILTSALEQIEENHFDADDCPAIVLGGKGWHPGVVGIVASRIVDKFHRPTFMISLNDEMGQGSGRSIAGFHLTRALEGCAEVLESFGGHEMAAGIKLRAANFPAFRAAFCQQAQAMLQPAMLQPELLLEASAELREFSAALVSDLLRLGPFGHANRRPLFCCPNLKVCAAPRRVGQAAQHLQLTVSQNGTSMRCIGFGLGPRAAELPVGAQLDLAAEPIINDFNGRRSVELEIRDLRLL